MTNSLNLSLADSALPRLFDKVFQKHGLDLTRYKIAFLKRRMDIRMRTRGVCDYIQYATLLNNEPEEFIELFKSLSINVTSFFRDQQVYDVVNSFINTIIENAKPCDQIRVWSAGCATGEEPYSIAILFNEALQNKKSINVNITATDVSRKAIDFAREGKYPSSSLKTTSKNFIDKYFQPIQQKDDAIEYQINLNLKQLVTFKMEDILSVGTQFFDMIFCRNVLIYYTKDAHELIFTKFHKSLTKNGLLVLGMDETMLGTTGEKLFSSMLPRERVYQKIE